MKKFYEALFFGNIFYGLCTVALSIETNLQLKIALNRFPFYLLIFLATVVYYSRIYYKTSYHISSDRRSTWYRTNRPAIRIFLLCCSAAVIMDIGFIISSNIQSMANQPRSFWLLILVVPVLGVLYTSSFLKVHTLRNVGWLKPFIIGFVWAGLATIFPVFFWHIRHNDQTIASLFPSLLFWLQNFLFITALAVVFDIKDYESDRKHQLLTFPARIGINATVRLVVIPMAIVSFAVLFFFLKAGGYNSLQLLFFALPYIALLLALYKLPEQKNLMFYLAGIDGLMFLKAICGIISLKFL